MAGTGGLTAAATMTMRKLKEGSLHAICDRATKTTTAQIFAVQSSASLSVPSNEAVEKVPDSKIRSVFRGLFIAPRGAIVEYSAF